MERVDVDERISQYEPSRNRRHMERQGKLLKRKGHIASSDRDAGCWSSAVKNLRCFLLLYLFIEEGLTKRV